VCGDVVERLAGADRRMDLGRGHRRREVEEAVRIGGRAMGAVAEDGQQPASVLLGEQGHAARQVGAGADEHDPVAPERGRRQAQVTAGVAHVDDHAVLVGARGAERGQPGRDARRTTGRGDDEVGVQDLLGAALGAPKDAHPGDAASVGGRGQAEGVRALRQADVRQLQHAAADVALDQRPPGHDRAPAGGGARELVAAD
jgi:hypothetical protein